MTGTYALKPRFQQLLRPVVGRLAAAGVTANKVTVLACGLAALFGACLIIAGEPRLFLLCLAFFLLRMMLNAADGMLAREFGQKTAAGVFLNELGDVAADAFCYLPFGFVQGSSAAWVSAIVALAAVSELVGITAVMAGATRRYDGPMGKSDRAVVFGALGFWIGIAGGLRETIAPALFTLVCVLLAITIANRVRHALAEANRNERCAASVAANEADYAPM